MVKVPRIGGWLAALAFGVPAICGAMAVSFYGQVVAAPDADVMVLATKLRHVTVAYSAKGPDLKSCNVRSGSDARVIDQMMCSLVASCLTSSWSGQSGVTRCVNARVDALEDGIGKQLQTAGTSPFPDEWLATGVEEARSAVTSPHRDRTPAPVRPGKWVFTELALSVGNTGQTGPSLLQWHKCVGSDQAADGLAALLEPPPYSSGLRFALPAECRDWNIKRNGKALSGAMACRTPTGASASGTISGDVSDDQIVFRRERTWKKPGGWARASFDTSAKREGDCSAKDAAP